MNIFITGGSGLIGEEVSKLLLKKKHKIICFDNYIHKKIKNDKIFYIKGDILNFKLIKKSLKHKKIDLLLHLAANLGVEKTEKNAFDCLDINIQGTKNILKACIEAKVKKIIFASSSEVYGNANNKPIKETSELMPKSHYGVSKVVGESYVQAFYERYKLKYNILRFFNVYGTKQRTDFVIPKFINNINNNKPIKIYGTGSQTRSFCHINDAANGVLKVITKGKSNEIYNIGNDQEHISILNLANLIKNRINRKSKIKKIPFNQSDRSIEREIFKRQPNINKIKKDTKFKPSINLKKGIEFFLKSNDKTI
jgi:UDP-glucose 4-epimerase